MEQVFHFRERGVTLISPQLSLDFGKAYMIDALLSIGGTIGVPKPRMVPAAMAGMKALVTHSDRLETLAQDYLDTEEPVFVLVSRVYNIVDPALNMGIEEHLDALGCRVIHLEHLEAGCMHVENEYANLYWPFGQHLLTGFGIIRAHKNLYPIYITNHGCGPDTALQHYIKRAMEGREYLHIEVDEHASKVGIITRLEAFLYSLDFYKNREDKAPKGGAVHHPGNRAEHSFGNGFEDGQLSLTAGGRDHASCDGGDCLACAAQDSLTKDEQEILLVPDFGIYTRLLAASYLRKADAPASTDGESPLFDDTSVCYVPPLKRHESFNYAINKEYYSLLIMLEEILRTVQKGKRYRLLFPTYEGAEVFGQYGRLILQELKRQGYEVTLEEPFLEDYLAAPDLADRYRTMLSLERAGAGSGEASREIMLIGEPLCIYKPAIAGPIRDTLNEAGRRSNRPAVAAGQSAMLLPEAGQGVMSAAASGQDGPAAAVDMKLSVSAMPLSEALLMFWHDFDRKGKYRKVLAELDRLHEAAVRELPALYTPMRDLMAAAAGRLDFCMGGFGRYRLAKTLCMDKEAAAGLVLAASAEENTAMVLKLLTEGLRDEIHLPLCRAELDYQHGLQKEDAQTFLYVSLGRS